MSASGTRIHSPTQRRDERLYLFAESPKRRFVKVGRSASIDRRLQALRFGGAMHACCERVGRRYPWSSSWQRVRNRPALEVVRVWDLGGWPDAARMEKVALAAMRRFSPSVSPLYSEWFVVTSDVAEVVIEQALREGREAVSA